MKKLIMAALLLGVFCVVKSEAGAGKTMYANKYSTTISTVAIGDAVLYSVLLSTPAAVGDYINFFDSANVIGLATGYISSAPFVFRLLYSTATAIGGTAGGSVLYTFNPPLQFDKGIMITPSSAADSALIVYEGGRP